MLVLETGDKIQGDAATAAEVDYTIHGLDNSALKQLADGQLANSIGDLFTADSTDVASTITLVNTGSAQAVNLYFLASGGTARRLIPKDMSLGAGYSLHTDGKSFTVVDASGNVQTSGGGAYVEDAAYGAGWNGDTTHAPSQNAVYDMQVAHLAAADPHAGYVLETLFDAQSIIQATSDNTPVKLTVAEQTVVGRITGGNIVALTVAQLQTLLFSAALPENVTIELDAALSADEKYSGIVETVMAGCTTNFGDCLYFAVADSRWELAKADASATSFGKIGINVETAQKSDGDSMKVLLYGKVRSDADYAFTVGAPVFISSGTAGDLTSTIPAKTTNHVVRIVGYGNTADELFFCPDNTYLEYA